MTIGAAAEKGGGWKMHKSFSMSGSIAERSQLQFDTNCASKSFDWETSRWLGATRVRGICMIKLTCAFAMSHGAEELVKFCIPLTIRAGNYLAPSHDLFQHCI